MTPDSLKPEKSQSGFCLGFHVSRKSDRSVKLQILLQNQGKDFFPFHVFPDPWGSFTLNPKMGQKGARFQKRLKFPSYFHGRKIIYPKQSFIRRKTADAAGGALEKKLKLTVVLFLRP